LPLLFLLFEVAVELELEAKEDKETREEVETELTMPLSFGLGLGLVLYVVVEVEEMIVARESIEKTEETRGMVPGGTSFNFFFDFALVFGFCIGNGMMVGIFGFAILASLSIGGGGILALLGLFLTVWRGASTL